ncbi:MAG: uracil phosphoribosyltransferase [Candidatus Azotimanducaceae bacterium]|jgi:uracil phosphoribosyltransferase
MTLHHLGENNSILNRFISEIRNISIQQDSMRFRRNIERIGEILSYELSKELTYSSSEIKTPLGNKSILLPTDNIVLCSILRAGLPLHNGLLNYFDNAENAFVSAYRQHINESEFEIKIEYLATPELEGKTLLLADPMLATGRSLVDTYNALLKNGTPKDIHIICVIGSEIGIEYVKKHFPKNTHLWIAAIDQKLNDKGYIIPGLGDAGDLSYGSKL